MIEPVERTYGVKKSLKTEAPKELSHSGPSNCCDPDILRFRFIDGADIDLVATALLDRPRLTSQRTLIERAILAWQNHSIRWRSRSIRHSHSVTDFQEISANF